MNVTKEEKLAIFRNVFVWWIEIGGLFITMEGI
jgi:hypothetical protein